VHLIRNSLNLASWKDRKALAAALKPIYQAATAEAAASALDTFTESDWGKKFPTVPTMWQRQWEQVIPFFAYPSEVRKIIYTTNAIESMHMQLHKIVKNRGHFPSDEATTKLLYLALRNIEKDWKMPPYYTETGGQSVRHPVRRTIHERLALRFFNPTSVHRISDTTRADLLDFCRKLNRIYCDRLMRSYAAQGITCA
jgi:putative transposase